MFGRVKYVRTGKGTDSPAMYVITRFRTSYGSWKVEVSPCDHNGGVVSDPIFWDIFPSWWEAVRCMRKQYKKWFEFVNGRC